MQNVLTFKNPNAALSENELERIKRDEVLFLELVQKFRAVNERMDEMLREARQIAETRKNLSKAADPVEVRRSA